MLCDTYQSSGAIIPVSLSADVFTTAAIDNIDHNTSSTTAADSFHGSSITVIQHPDVPAPVPTLQLADLAWSRTVRSTLPDSYTCVPATGNVAYEIPIASINTSSASQLQQQTLQQLFPWLNMVESVVYGTMQHEHSSFAAFHSMTAIQPQPVLPCNHTLLPLLPDHIQSPATTRHLMNTILHITTTLNKQQPAVITADQPVYALAKAVQWKYPDLYGEDRLVMMMGGLHIEMAVQNMIGKWLAGSGWTDIFIKAGVATTGRCESLLKSSHVKRTRYAHEVSLAALYILRNEAHLADVDDTPESLEPWVLRRCTDSAQFLYWQTAMELEALLLGFVRSIRESSFTLYVQMLKEICPWFFALDLTHYSRWLPVFIKTLEELPVRHPKVHEAFQKGHFTSRKTASNFSALSDDHLHEQNNKIIKGDGGAIGIFGNETALLKWMVGGPEISRMVHEFEQTVGSSGDSHSPCHHEVSKHFQSRFIGHVSKVVLSLREDGNPFAEQELQTADSQKLILTATAEKSVIEARTKGQQKYQEFVEDRLVYGRKPLHAPIQRTNLELFVVQKLQLNSHRLKITDLRHDSNTFCKLYVASQSRAGNVDDFFAHENNQYPPSVSDCGKLRKAKNKSDILACFEDYIPQLECESANSAESAPIVDGAALVHMLSPGPAKTFKDYCTTVLWPHVRRLLQSVQRVDIVFDRYFHNSLKSQTREVRGSGQRINVTPGTLIPKKFNSFLAVDGNKQQLFHLLAQFLLSQETANKILICTVEDRACTTCETVNVSSISPCTAEEADGRLLLHADHAARNGLNCITVRTVDSDVVVIAVYAYSHMCGIKELWIDFGVGKYRKLIPVHKLSRNMPHSLISNLPFFHAFTGCDTVSSFCDIGKRTAWKTWLNFRDVDESFDVFSSSSDVTNKDAVKYIERYVVLMYDQTSACARVNDCRRLLYTRKNREIENIPPTSDALLQHCKRAALQAHIWRDCLCAEGPAYDPTEWGWKVAEDGDFAPLWCTIPDISSHCAELVKCSCKTLCQKNCKCRKYGLRCTKLCACDGQCSDHTSSVDSHSDIAEAGDLPWEEVEEDTEADHELNIVFEGTNFDN